MPCAYRLLATPRVLHTTFRGTVTDEEFVQLYREALNDPDYELGTDEFADLREVEHFRVSSEALRDVVILTGRRYEGSSAVFRSAVVAADDAAYGVSRIYEVFAGGTPEGMQVFRTVTEAFAWLGVTEPTLIRQLSGGAT